MNASDLIRISCHQGTKTRRIKNGEWRKVISSFAVTRNQYSFSVLHFHFSILSIRAFVS